MTCVTDLPSHEINVRERFTDLELRMYRKYVYSTRSEKVTLRHRLSTRKTNVHLNSPFPARTSQLFLVHSDMNTINAVTAEEERKGLVNLGLTGEQLDWAPSLSKLGYLSSDTIISQGSSA